MQYRKVPGTTLEVSSLCLGTMTWGEQNIETVNARYPSPSAGL